MPACDSCANAKRGSVIKMKDIKAETLTFSALNRDQQETHEILRCVYDALVEKGYNPINQIVGYILTEDPTYITNHKGARALIRKIDRDELLNDLVKCYLNV